MALTAKLRLGHAQISRHHDPIERCFPPIPGQARAAWMAEFH
jgi:hypothetical protein